jgi:hypothetical protein
MMSASTEQSAIRLPTLARFLSIACAALLLVVATGCGDEDGNNGGIGEGASGTISIQPSSVTFSKVDIGSSATQTVTIRNVSQDPLTVLRLELVARDGLRTDNFRLIDTPTSNTRIEGNGSVEFQVEYSPSDTNPDGATIEIVSTDPTTSQQNPASVDVFTVDNLPELSARPNPVRFARIPAGERTTQPLVLRNVGSAPLTIFEEPSYSGSNAFSVSTEGRIYPLTLQPYDNSEAQEDPKAYELQVDVRYAPEGGTNQVGEIFVVSDDTSGTEGDDGRYTKAIPVDAAADAACILVDGLTRRFGQVPIGQETTEIVTVTNCGSKTLEISSITITENSTDEEYELELGDWDGNGDERIDSPVRIEPGEDDLFRIDYAPIQVGQDTGMVQIASNDPAQPTLDLELIGRGSDGECPEANLLASVRGVSAAPRQSVSTAPLEYVILDGSSSMDPDGRIPNDPDNWNFEVLSAPDGVNPRLGPTAEDPNDDDQSKREFRLLTAGTYEIGLTVTDNEGFQSCNQAVVTITAIPNEALHVELTWTNPEDPDETDDSGSDVDLHLVKMGPGEWFESPYDIFFRNPNGGSTGGGAIWNPESPSLDIDDTDGAGPENIQMDDPVNCEWYAVGVHYWREQYGAAFATVRIYVNERLVYEQINRKLEVDGAFWDVARVHWNQGTATVVDVDNLMQASPAGQEPEVTEAMADTELCTTRGLY